MNNEKPRRRSRGLSFQSYDDLQQRQPEKYGQPNVLAPIPIRQKPPASLIDEIQASILHPGPLHADTPSVDQLSATDDQSLSCGATALSEPIKTKPEQNTGSSLDKAHASMNDAMSLVAAWFAHLLPGSESEKKIPQTSLLQKPNLTQAATTLKPLPLHLGSAALDPPSTHCVISPQDSSLLSGETSFHTRTSVACADPMGIIHNIGYCGPAVLGLQLYELIAQRVITLESHDGRYHDPIRLVLRLFSAHYETIPLSVDDFVNMLSEHDSDSIQWIMSPIVRLTLLCFLKSNELSCTSPLFNRFDTDYNFFTDHEKVQTSLAVSNDCLEACLNILHEENQPQSCQSPPTSTESLRGHAYRKYHLAPDDLFLLCRLFSLKLDLRLNCVTDDQLQTTKKEIDQQILNRLDMQDSYFTENDIKPFVAVQVVYEAFVFKDHAIDGHFDAILNDALLVNRRRCYSELPRPKEMDAYAQRSHGDGESFLKSLIQQKQSCVTLDKSLPMPSSNQPLSPPIKRATSTTNLSVDPIAKTASDGDSSDDLVEIRFAPLSIFQFPAGEPSNAIHTDSVKVDLAKSNLTSEEDNRDFDAPTP